MKWCDGKRREGTRSQPRRTPHRKKVIPVRAVPLACEHAAAFEICARIRTGTVVATQLLEKLFLAVYDSVSALYARFGWVLERKGPGTCAPGPSKKW